MQRIKNLLKKIVGRKTTENITHVSTTGVWSTLTQTEYRTVLGRRIWKIKIRNIACKHGQPHIAAN